MDTNPHPPPRQEKTRRRQQGRGLGSGALVPRALLRLPLSGCEWTLLCALWTLANRTPDDTHSPDPLVCCVKRPIRALELLTGWERGKVQRYLTKLIRRSLVTPTTTGWTLHEPPNGVREGWVWLPVALCGLELRGLSWRVYGLVESAGGLEGVVDTLGESYMAVWLKCSRDGVAKAKADLKALALLRSRQRKRETVAELRLYAPKPVCLSDVLDELLAPKTPSVREGDEKGTQDTYPVIYDCVRGGARARRASLPLSPAALARRRDVLRPNVSYPYLVESLLAMGGVDERDSATLIGWELDNGLVVGPACLPIPDILARCESYVQWGGHKGHGGSGSRLPLHTFLRHLLRRWRVDPCHVDTGDGGVLGARAYRFGELERHQRHQDAILNTDQHGPVFEETVTTTPRDRPAGGVGVTRGRMSLSQSAMVVCSSLSAIRS